MSRLSSCVTATLPVELASAKCRSRLVIRIHMLAAAASSISAERTRWSHSLTEPGL